MDKGFFHNLATQIVLLQMKVIRTVPRLNHNSYNLYLALFVSILDPSSLHPFTSLLHPFILSSHSIWCIPLAHLILGMWKHTLSFFLPDLQCVLPHQHNQRHPSTSTSIHLSLVQMNKLPLNLASEFTISKAIRHHL